MWSTTINSVKVICDLLLSLIKHGSAERKNVFESHVEPVFQQMLAIHEDYISVIAEVIRLLQDYSTSPEEIRDTLVDRKRKLEHIRRLVLELAQALEAARHENLSNPVHAFAKSIVFYFWSTAGGFSVAVGKTRLTGLIDLTEELMQGDMDRDWFESKIKWVEDDLQKSWSKVSECYAKLRTRAL